MLSNNLSALRVASALVSKNADDPPRIKPDDLQQALTAREPMIGKTQ